jgi:hypothetical protein
MRARRGCIEPLAVGACRKAWAEALAYCRAHHSVAERTCAEWRADPASFLVPRVLRAKVNPIDAVYTCALCCAVCLLNGMGITKYSSLHHAESFRVLLCFALLRQACGCAAGTVGGEGSAKPIAKT